VQSAEGFANGFGIFLNPIVTETVNPAKREREDLHIEAPEKRRPDSDGKPMGERLL